MRLTIPPCEEDEYNHILTIIWPFFGIPVMWMIISMKWVSSWMFLIYLGPAVVWVILWVWAKKPENNKIPSGYIVIELLGMVCGFIWTYYVSGMMIDILTMVGILSKLSATYLALTIIAVGNALPDALLTVSLA